MRGLRTFRTALLVGAGLILGPGVAAAQAGPGLQFYPKDGAPVRVSGGQISALADVPRTTYRLPNGRSITVAALTIRGLLEWKQVSPGAVAFVKIGRNHVVRQGQFASGLLSDDGTTTRYFRAGGGTVRDLASARLAPLEVFVHKGVDIAVEASARPRRVTVGKRITFRARVKTPSPSAQYSYTWSFGDGRTATGKTVSHVYDAALSTTAVEVTVHDSDPSCNPACNGNDRVFVQVGDRPKRRKAPEPTPGGATGSPGGPGSAAGTGGGGQGGSGGDASGTGTGARSARGSTAAKRKPPPPPSKAFGTKISGVLIEDSGTTVRKLPDGRPAGAPKGARAIRGGDPGRSLELPLSALLALGMISLGALRERRAVRMGRA